MCARWTGVRSALFPEGVLGGITMKNTFDMKPFRRPIVSLALLACVQLNAQFDASQVQYWVGAGADTSILVVDFQDGSFDGQSFAWGYLHNGATGEDMLNAIAAADINFSVNIAGGFLNDIIYGAHAGIGGSPDYWSTWSGTNIATMTMNGGLATPLANGDWFACSYTDFNPALAPTEPWAAFDPLRFTAEDVIYWVGAGQDSAVLIIDFQDGSTPSSYAWGYAFDGATTGETMLNAIAAADPALNVVIAGGFLNDITYNAHAGIGGSPNYWSTWSGTNLGNWFGNLGVGTTVNNGDLFGCSYTDFAPALRPGYPVAAEFSTGIADNTANGSVQVYPQPATDLLYVNTGARTQQPIILANMAGQRVFQGTTNGSIAIIAVNALPAGMYILQAGDEKRTVVVN